MGKTRKRRGLRRFEGNQKIRLCRDCSKKLPNKSLHHYYCVKCWKKRNKKKAP